MARTYQCTICGHKAHGGELCKGTHSAMDENGAMLERSIPCQCGADYIPAVNMARALLGSRPKGSILASFAVGVFAGALGRELGKAMKPVAEQHASEQAAKLNREQCRECVRRTCTVHRMAH